MDIDYIKIIKSKFDIDPLITDEVDMDGYRFLFFIPKEGIHPATGERLHYVTNVGPMRVDLKTGEYDFMAATDFAFIYGDRLELKDHFSKFKLTYQEKVRTIRLRKELWWDDFVELFEKVRMVSLFENADMFSNNLLDIEFENLTDEGKKVLVPFLEDTGATYAFKSEDHIVVQLKIE